MLHDAEFFQSRISKLDGAADLGDYLIKIIKEKAVVDTPQQENPPVPISESKESSTDKESSIDRAPKGDKN